MIIREPSLHINRKNLKKILDEYIEGSSIGLKANDLVQYLLRRGRSYQLSNRKILENAKNIKRLTQIRRSVTENAKLFAVKLLEIRIKRKHKSVNLIKIGTVEWGFVKEGAALATLFCNNYGLERKHGYSIYISEALDTMKRYSLRSLNSKHQLICERYDAKIIINNDLNSHETQIAYETYQQIIYEKTGVTYDYIKNSPDKYIYFIEVVIEAKRLGLSPELYVKAQFEALSWTKGIPLPQQLVTYSAQERMIKWMAENDINTKEIIRDEDIKDLLLTLKKARKRDSLKHE